MLGFDDVEFRRMEVYDVGALGETFDLVIFMGVLYHLRHPLLALDLIREHVARDLLLFQRDNEVASVRVEGKVSVMLCRDRHFTNYCQLFTESRPNLPRFLSHAVSSYRVY